MTKQMQINYEKLIEKFKVTFKDKEGNVISEQEVELGKNAVEPEIPEYEEWNGKKVNNRIWIKVK